MVQPPEGDPEEGDPEQRRPRRDLSNCVWKRQGAYRIRALGTGGAYGRAGRRPPGRRPISPRKLIGLCPSGCYTKVRAHEFRERWASSRYGFEPDLPGGDVHRPQGRHHPAFDAGDCRRSGRREPAGSVRRTGTGHDPDGRRTDQLRARWGDPRGRDREIRRRGRTGRATNRPRAARNAARAGLVPGHPRLGRGSHAEPRRSHGPRPVEASSPPNSSRSQRA